MASPGSRGGQARNTDAERKACEVRLRAERRTGELLKELARADTAKGGDLKSASQARDTDIAITLSGGTARRRRTARSR